MNSLFLYILFYFIYSHIGWLIEVSAIYITKHTLINRGFLIGPICPIYGVCAILMILLLTPFINSPVLLFIIALMICSFIEYITSYIMEKVFNARWWDYSDRPFNINGRIYLLNSIAFGLLGTILMYIVNPCLWKIMNKIPMIIIYSCVIVFILLFIIDCIISFNVVLKIKKVTRFVKGDNTKEISEKVKEILKSTSFLGKRLMLAFPDIKFIIKDFGTKVEKKISKISNRGVK